MENSKQGLQPSDKVVILESEVETGHNQRLVESSRCGANFESKFYLAILLALGINAGGGGAAYAQDLGPKNNNNVPTKERLINPENQNTNDTVNAWKEFSSTGVGAVGALISKKIGKTTGAAAGAILDAVHGEAKGGDAGMEIFKSAIINVTPVGRGAALVHDISMGKLADPEKNDPKFQQMQKDIKAKQIDVEVASELKEQYKDVDKAIVKLKDETSSLDAFVSKSIKDAKEDKARRVALSKELNKPSDEAIAAAKAQKHREEMQRQQNIRRQKEKEMAHRQKLAADRAAKKRAILKALKIPGSKIKRMKKNRKRMMDMMNDRGIPDFNSRSGESFPMKDLNPFVERFSSRPDSGASFPMRDLNPFAERF